MSKSPHNAGQTIEIEHLIHGPVSTVDLGKITVTENWGRLFIKQGDSNEVVIERGAYVALRDAIDHFIEPQPDPSDEVIAALVEALQNMIEGYEEWDLTGGTLILRPIHLQTSWIQRAKAAIAAVKGGDA